MASFGKTKKGQFYKKNPDVDFGIGFSDKELEQQKKKANLEHIQKVRAEHIAGAIDRLRSEHGHKNIIGAKPLSKRERVELNNLLVKEYSKHYGDDTFKPRTVELMDRVPPETADALAGLASQGALGRETIRNGRVELEDKEHQKWKEQMLAKMKRDDPKEYNAEMKERAQAEKLYNKKYDKWGMKK